MKTYTHRAIRTECKATEHFFIFKIEHYIGFIVIAIAIECS